MTLINAKSVIVSRSGGNLDIISADGELLSSIAVPAGRVRIAQYLDLLPDGASFEAGDGLELHQPRHRIGIQPYGDGSHDSGANPDFAPTSSSRLEREMRLQINRMKANNDVVERRMRQLDTVERVPLAPEGVTPPVTEVDQPLVE